MIITKAEVKQLLRIDSSNTEYDDYIDTAIAPLQRWVEEYLSNNFLSDRVYYRGEAFEFVSESAQILDSTGYFTEYQFMANKDIHIDGSYKNDGIYEIQEVTAGALTLPDGSLVDEDMQGHTYRYKVTIAEKEYPEGIKPTIAKLIGFNLKNGSFNDDDSEYKSESFINYSYSQDTPMIIKSSSGYPKYLLDGLNAYKNKKVKLL